MIIKSDIVALFICCLKMNIHFQNQKFKFQLALLFPRSTFFPRLNRKHAFLAARSHFNLFIDICIADIRHSTCDSTHKVYTVDCRPLRKSDSNFHNKTHTLNIRYGIKQRRKK